MLLYPGSFKKSAFTHTFDNYLMAPSREQGTRKKKECKGRHTNPYNEKRSGVQEA